MRVIGIVGKAGSGKDTVARHLMEQHRFAKGQFARVLKDIVCDVYGWDREAVDSDEAAQAIGFESALAYKEAIPLLEDGTPQCPGPNGFGLTRRQVFQHIGTEGFRYCAEDTWVRCEMDNVPKDAQGVVFPDVRFLNEAEAIRKLGGEVWRVWKIGGTGTSFVSHQSETEMEKIEVDRAIGAAHGEIPLLLARVDSLLK